jgi:ATP-binding cassette, sub-family E, member 1
MNQAHFLDIKQHIIISDIIKEKCTLDTYLVCVEHDLCILDYICEYVICLYGVTNCYGVITSIQGARNGINSYLDGYFKNENLKFRDEPVHFNKYLIEKSGIKLECIYEYNKFSIDYDKFCLTANGGKINMNEITLLIGENGTGKTSFIKKIAENENIITSIKLQNPYIKYDKRVIDYLEENINKALCDNRFIFGVIKALDMDKLYDVCVNNLSGGQMQKLSIITCLGKSANLYLLDEPSAFIDIEDRCKIAKIIKKFAYDNKTTIYIIEHDITLATNIADKVIVFEGIPGIKCTASEPYDLFTGINLFLKNINVTMRKDSVSGRPGINKLNSQKDIEQKQTDKYFIIE